MGAESVERQLERLHHGDGRAAEFRQAKGHPGRLRDRPPDAAQLFYWSYAQTDLRLHKVIRGRGSIRSRYIDVEKASSLSLNLSHFASWLILKGLAILFSSVVAMRRGTRTGLRNGGHRFSPVSGGYRHAGEEILTCLECNNCLWARIRLKMCWRHFCRLN